MATTSNNPDFSETSHEVDTQEMARIKWSTWTNFKHLVFWGALGALAALSLLWFVTY